MKKRIKKRWKYAVGITLFIAANILAKVFLIDVVKVKGHSMTPTLQSGSYVLVSRCAAGMRCPRNIFEVPWLNVLCYYLVPHSYIDSTLQNAPHAYRRLVKPRIKRGDIVVFNLPYYLSSTAVKRCIGMPGDSLHLFTPKRGLLPVIPYTGMRLAAGQYTAAQQDTLQRLYFFRPDKASGELVSTTNFYFVQGDNHHGSIGSRTWGLLPEDHIFAKVLFTLF